MLAALASLAELSVGLADSFGSQAEGCGLAEKIRRLITVYEHRSGEIFPFGFVHGPRRGDQVEILSTAYYEAETFQSSADLFTEVYRPKLFNGLLPEVAYRIGHASADSVVTLAEEAKLLKLSQESESKIRERVFLATRKYQEIVRKRRKWSPEFIGGMLDTSRNTLRRSSWVVVRRPAGTSNGPEEVLAAVRIVESRYIALDPKPLSDGTRLPTQYFSAIDDSADLSLIKRHVLNGGGRGPTPLPIEKSLKTGIDRPVHWIGETALGRVGVGVVYEPGAWFLDKSINEVGFAETWLHILATVGRKPPGFPANFSHDGIAIWTYSDPSTLPYYTRTLGFTNQSDTPIEAHGTRWWKLRGSVPSTQQVIENLERIKTGISFEKAEEYRTSLGELIRHYQGSGARSQ